MGKRKNADVNRVAKICERLGSNPVTHLGLSGKELFHSNMLAWLFQQYPKPMTEAFGDLLAPDPAQHDLWFEVFREWTNLDLVVCVPGRRPLVVENKTFSLLDERQLQRYSEHSWVQAQDPALVLLSLGDPGWRERRVDTPAGKRTWEWLSYREVAKRLRKVGVEINDDFDRRLLERYCDVIDDLVRLAESLASPEPNDSPVHLREAVLKPLREIRLSDGLLKLRSAGIAQRIDPRVGSGFTRGEPLIQAWGAGPKRLVGWQLQSRQFRLCASFNDLAGPSPKLQKARSEVAKRLKDAGTWFDFSEVERLLGPKASVPSGARPDQNGFNRYNPAFVYSYRHVPDLTQGQLIRLGRFYLKAAMAAPIPQQ